MNPRPPDQSGWTFLKYFVATAALILVIAFCLLCYPISVVMHSSRIHYTQWNLGFVITEYMDKNEGKWPRSKDDLKQYPVGWIEWDYVDRLVLVDYDLDLQKTTDGIRSGSIAPEDFHPITYKDIGRYKTNPEMDGRLIIYKSLKNRLKKQALGE